MGLSWVLNNLAVGQESNPRSPGAAETCGHQVGRRAPETFLPAQGPAWVSPPGDPLPPSAGLCLCKHVFSHDPCSQGNPHGGKGGEGSTTPPAGRPAPPWALGMFWRDAMAGWLSAWAGGCLLFPVAIASTPRSRSVKKNPVFRRLSDA